MVKRIDIFMPPYSQYEVLHHFSRKLSEAFVRLGVDCRLLTPDNPRDFLDDIFNDPPDFTLAFNGLLPDPQGNFLCDFLKIPHVACLVDSPNRFLPLINSPYTIITSVDRFSCNFYKELNFQNSLFMPHAVEKDIAYNPAETRPYDVLFLSSCYDFQEAEEQWKQKYSKKVCQALYDAAEITLSEPDTFYYQALNRSLEAHKIDPSQCNLNELHESLEGYFRGLDRIRLIKSIKTARVDIFSSNSSKKTWEKYLGKDDPRVILHDEVNFEQALQLMNQAKIVASSCPWIKDGAHERIFSGLACGAVVLTSQNIYLREHFNDGENILLYHPNKMDSIDDKINDILADNTHRQQIAHHGRDIVLRSHTWDERAKVLLRDLAPILAQFNE